MFQKHKYMSIGVTVFLTVCAILLFYDTIFGSGAILTFGRKFLEALMPVLYGAFLAYLLAPMVDIFEDRLFPGLMARSRAKGKATHPVARSVSLIMIWVLIAIGFYLLASVLLPELYKSLLMLIGNIETYYFTIVGWIELLLDNNPALESWVGQQLETWVGQQLENSYGDLVTWITKEVMPQAQQLMTLLSGGVVSVAMFLLDLLVGIIASVYLMASKETISAHARKIVYSLFAPQTVPWVLRATRKADSIFSGFVRGKLLDSLIIGLICFAGCSLLKFPYTPLVSVVVGVTNIIPFFGPFLGAIPSAFLILLASPLQAVYFGLFVLALQQLDGNVIGPLILGDKTGLSSIWVIAAILVGGSFFGVAGMFFGVPVCACLYSAGTFLVEHWLKKKGLPVETAAYTRLAKPERDQDEEDQSL